MNIKNIFYLVFIILISFFIVLDIRKRVFLNPSVENLVVDTLTPKPKIIYTFWNNTNNIPLSIQYSINTMKRKNPNWKVIILNDKNIPKELLHLDNAKKSDYIRLQKISQTGGVWLDASIVCVKPIEEWININSNNIQGFRVPFNGYTMESWAFAAPKNSLFCKVWYQEFSNAIKKGLKKYCNEIPFEIIPKNDKLRNNLPYLTIHACWRVAHYKLPNTNIELKESCDGPLKYLCIHHNEKDSINKSINFIINKTNNENIKDLPNIIKLRGTERKIIDPMLKKGQYNKDSLLAKSWNLP